jgi:hypothetical protein
MLAAQVDHCRVRDDGHRRRAGRKYEAASVIDALDHPAGAAIAGATRAEIVARRMVHR